MTGVINVVDSSDDEDCVIQSVEFNTAMETSNRRLELYEEIKPESKLLANFIAKCLDIEDSEEMLHTLKSNLLENYYKVEKSVRDGPKIQKALLRANNLLLNDPYHKYSHIKDLRDILKSSQVKKKVPFVTLSTNLKTDDNHGETNGQNTDNEAQIVVEHAEANGQNPSNEVQIIDINCGVNGLKRTHKDPIIANNNKKPKLITETHNPTTDDLASNNINGPNETIELLDDSAAEENCSQESCISEESLLVAKEVVPIELDDPVRKANEIKIKKLERKISLYKKEIARLDELEVDDDSVKSPYIRSERLKSLVVVLYKQLCELTGHQPTKDKEIRLQVVDGHPPGPTKILEAFLNKNVDSNGNLPFPDFCDVVNCVRESNVKDDLGWAETQIMKEAYMLFTHCGRALQKRRQKREYRDLLQKVKLEECERDPADDDPALLARLQENKRLSEKKEAEILDRYTKMQALPTKTKSQNQQGHSSNINNKTVKQDDTLNLNNNDILKSKMAKLNVKTTSCKNSIPGPSKVSVNESKVEPKTIDIPNSIQKLKEKYCGKKENDKEVEGPGESSVSNSDAEAKNIDSSPIIDVSKSSTIATKLPQEATIESSSKESRIMEYCNVKNIQESSRALEPKITKDQNFSQNTIAIKLPKEASSMVSRMMDDCSIDNDQESSRALELKNMKDQNSNIESEIKCGKSAEHNVESDISCVDSNIETNGQKNRRTEEENYLCTNIEVTNHENNNKQKLNTESEIICGTSSNVESEVSFVDTNIKTDGVRSTEQEEILAKDIKQEPEEDIINKLHSLGENFSLTVETISDPFLIIEISDSSDEE